MMMSSCLAIFCLALVINVQGESLVQSPDIGKLYRQLLEKNAVRHMTVHKVDKLRSAFLIHGRPIGSQPSKVSVAAPFHWESCGPASQLVDVRNLTITPSPVSFPGPLNFGFDIIFHDTISPSAKVEASVKIDVNARGVWIPLPCIGSIGSCTYDDLCSLLQKIQCPSDLTKQGIPCACPFEKGEYKLQKYSVQIDASVFLTGNYRAQAILKDSVKGQIACYTITFTVD